MDEGNKGLTPRQNAVLFVFMLVFTGAYLGIGIMSASDIP